MEWIKVRKKPVEVESFQLKKEMLSTKIREVTILTTIQNRVIFAGHINFLVETLEGDMKAAVGDYIIKGVKGEIYPCRKDIFEETYE